MKKILTAICLSTCLLGFSGCQDDMLDEITSLEFDRALSPTELDARVVNKTGVRLNWKDVNNASSYTIELFDNVDFSGSPVKSVENISIDQVPYTLSGLSGETDYSVRVKAVGEGINDSKWITATFKTDAEQIFQNLELEKIQAKSVTLNWTPGETATTIVLNPGNISHTVTAEEVAAGEATVTGLTPETAYTAMLLNGTKTRGTLSFNTIIDLGDAIAVTPADDLVALVTAAVGGETFALMPGTYTINADLGVSKSISIVAAKPADRPVINGLVFRIKANAGLTLKDLILDGTGSTGNQTIVYDDELTDPYGELNVQNSEIKNYLKGLVYVSKKTLIEGVTFKGNIIHDIKCEGGDFIDFRQGLAKTLLFENNTVYNSASAGDAGAASRDLFRMDPNGSTNFPSVTSIITIRTNTFYNVSNLDSKRILYIRLASQQIHFTKNIIANTKGYYSNQGSTTITTMEKNNYFDAPNFTASTQSNAKNDNTGTHTDLDPGFTDPSAGNFRISNEDLKFNGIGDPRWH